MVDAVIRPIAVAENHKPDHDATPAAERCAGAIDRDHLARMTLGEPGLDHEVLRLFERQATMLLARMMQEPPAAIAAHAHTLAGSARGIGAWMVADAAATLERQATQPGLPLTAAMDRLVAAVADAHAAIADLLRPH